MAGNVRSGATFVEKGVTIEVPDEAALIDSARGEYGVLFCRHRFASCFVGHVITADHTLWVCQNLNGYPFGQFFGYGHWCNPLAVKGVHTLQKRTKKDALKALQNQGTPTNE